MRKLPNNILEDIKKLKDIEFSADAKSQVKNRLMSELQFAPSKKAGKVGTAFSLAGLLTKQSLRQLSAKPVGVFVILMGIVIGPGIATVSAARSSLPGDTLYPLKRGLEHVELTFTFTEKSKAEKEINQVAVRLTELHRIAQEQVPSPEREQKIVLALEELKKDTADVKKRLETAKKTSEAEKTDDAIAIAKYIEERTADYKESLKTSVEQLNVEETENVEDIELALSTVQEVAIDALDIIVKDHEDGSETLTKDELKTRVEGQLATVKQQTESLKGRVALVLGQELAASLAVESEKSEDDQSPSDESEETEAEESTEISKEDEATEVVENEDVVKESPVEVISQRIADEVDPQITFVEELIELGEFGTALTKLTAVKSVVDELTMSLRSHRQKMDAQLSAGTTKDSSLQTEKTDVEEVATEEETVDQQSNTEAKTDS